MSPYRLARLDGVLRLNTDSRMYPTKGILRWTGGGGGRSSFAASGGMTWYATSFVAPLPFGIGDLEAVETGGCWLAGFSSTHTGARLERMTALLFGNGENEEEKQSGDDMVAGLGGSLLLREWPKFSEHASLLVARRRVVVEESCTALDDDVL